MCSCTRPHVCPGDRLRHLEVYGDHGCLELASRDEAFPTAGTSRECALHLQVPHHKTDTMGSTLHGSQTASFVPKHSHKEAHADHFAARVVPFIALVVASLSRPAVDSIPLMSRRLLPAFLLSARRSPCLISWSHQLSGPSGSPK